MCKCARNPSTSWFTPTRLGRSPPARRTSPAHNSKAALGKRPSLETPRAAISLLVRRDYPEIAVRIARSRREVQQVLFAVGCGPPAELNSPQTADLDGCAGQILDCAHQRTGRKIESVDRTPVHII